MIAAVALGAVACQNDIDDNLSPEQNGESVSIRVTLNDATKVALSDFVEDKGYKLDFEEGDQLFVFAGSGHEAEGYYFEYTKPEGEDTYVFTCSAEGVSAIVGTYQYIYYQGGREGATDAFGNYADQTIKGVFIEGYGKIGTTPIAMKMAPVLKFKSAYPVLIEASNWVFNGYKRATSVDTENWVYISTHGAYTIDITATINGKPAWVKGVNGAEDKATGTLTLAMEYNKIYNLGELIPEPVIADVANIEIDGDFSDWEAVTTNVATLAAGATSYTAVKTLKAYATSTHFYFYVEYDATDVENMHINMDLDLNSATGTQQAWMWSNKSNFRLQVSPYSYNDDHSTQTISESPYWSRKYWTTDWVTDSEVTVDDCTIVKLGNGNHAIEFSIPRSTNINTSITGESVGIGYYMDKGSYGSWAIPGYLPQNGSLLVIPVPAAE